jgi:hypothetical protein
MYFLHLLKQRDCRQVDHNFNPLPSNIYVCKPLAHLIFRFVSRALICPDMIFFAPQTSNSFMSYIFQTDSLQVASNLHQIQTPCFLYFNIFTILSQRDSKETKFS